MSGPIDMQHNRIRNLGQPKEDTDAANKQHVSSSISALNLSPIQTGSVSAGFTSDVFSGPVYKTITWQKINNFVTVNIPAVVVNAPGTGSADIIRWNSNNSSNLVGSEWFVPTNPTSVVVQVTNNGSEDYGLLTVGAVPPLRLLVGVGPTGADFANTGIMGFGTVYNSNIVFSYYV